MTNEKTRNTGRWTPARYKGFITSTLRGGFRRWPPKWDVLKDACTGVKKNKKTGRQAKHYKCAICERQHTSTAMQVDHKDPIGSTTDWNVFIERLFCEAPNLQAVCKPCHKKKTKKERQPKT